MTRKFSVPVLISWVLMMPAGLMAQGSDQTLSPAAMQAVLANFPKEFLSRGEPPTAAQDDPEDHSRTCATVFSRKDDGSPDLIAAIYDGDRTEVAMLAYEKGAARMIDAVDDRQFNLGGEFCSIQIINLADPADSSSPLAKTVVASFDTNLSESDYYFVWNGEKLVNVAALNNGSHAVVDIDHRGPMQIEGFNGDGDRFPQDDGIMANPTYTLFRYNGTTYAPAEVLLSDCEVDSRPVNWNEASSGRWTSIGCGVEMHKTPALAYQLIIVNGDRDGSNRVTSAKVEINGVTVVSPTEVNQGMESLTRTIRLRKENQITTVVDGPPKSHLHLVIE
jgi:hypothetical protein